MVKLQHYVPQTYLRAFCADGDQLWVFDKVERRSFRTHVRNVGGERYFYHPKSQDQPLERQFGRLESLYRGTYERLAAARDSAALGDDDRVLLALFMAALMVRTREHRQQIDQLQQKLREFVGMYAEAEGADPDPVRHQHVFNLSGDTIPRFAEMMLALQWTLLINPTPQPFWSSDHPVTLYNPAPSGLQGNLGLACVGIQVFVPLSPWLALALSDRRYDGVPSTGAVIPENVEFQNHLQMVFSNRYVFSPDHDFALAERILTADPTLADPNRPRLGFA